MNKVYSIVFSLLFSFILHFSTVALSNFSSVNAQSLPTIPFIPSPNDNSVTNDVLNGILQQEQAQVMPFDPLEVS
jgi:hypothetical protein